MKTCPFDEAARYRIRVEGRLGQESCTCLDGMHVVAGETGVSPGTTDLVGWVTDQAALMGLLDHLYRRGATLLNVERLDASAAGAPEVNEDQP